ncbi:MAG: hypothetical protein M1833_001194 [Piccolia ochrophora]|nr:MAG: hypothetical protein M1833_001194 [Piccolia ochrophora]
MSATPPTQAGRTPNGGRPQHFRPRPRNADPLVRPKNRRERRPQPAPASGAARPLTNGVTTAANSNASSHRAQQNVRHPPVALQAGQAATQKPAAAIDAHGFSVPPQTEKPLYWPLLTTKKALREGLRFHVARFASKKDIKLDNEEQFTRPVRLHRRDPRAPPAGAGGQKDAEGDAGATDSKDGVLDEQERKRQEALQHEKEAQKQADLAQIAPSVNQPGGASKKQNPFKKKTQKGYHHNQTPEEQRRSKLRYEESLPWHLEDFDNKNTWVGNYESALSDVHVAIVPGQDGFTMIPVEKWYRFIPKNQFKTLSIEEAEARMGKKVKDPRWFMESQKGDLQKKIVEQDRNMGGKLFLGKWERRTDGPVRKSEAAEADDLDFVEDRFADDEEGGLFEHDDEEEARETEERIKRDQLQANIFNLKDEKEYDKEEEEEKKEADLTKKHGKTMRKALRKREKNYIYEEDSDGNPYTEQAVFQSTSEDTDDDTKKDEDQTKKGEEKVDKVKLKDGGKSLPTDSPSSKAAQGEQVKKSSSRKRPTSPSLSEVSGTESARKKSKKKHGSSSQPTASNTPAPGSRAMSPAPSSSAPDVSRSQPPQRKSSIVRLSVESSKLNEISSMAPKPQGKRGRAGAGSGSDAEATGGEMSEGARKKKKNNLRMNGTSPDGSPTSSRAGSPNPTSNRQGMGIGGGSRASSPPMPVTLAEIIQSIPETGISIGELTARFKDRIQDKGVFIANVKSVSTYSNKMLYPRQQPAPKNS